jgi:hypothetical protein
MPALVVPNTVQVRLIWRAGGVQYAVNVIHFRNQGAVAVNQTLANQLATEVATAWGLAVGASGLINSSTAIDQVRVRDINSANQPEFTAQVTGANGNGTSEILPRQVALVVTLRTALAGRSYRGRVYVPGFAEAANDSTGRAVIAAQGIAEGLVNNIRSGFAGRGLLMGVVSTRANKAPRPTNIITDVTTAATRDGVWDNQRRRNVVGIGV